MSDDFSMVAETWEWCPKNGHCYEVKRDKFLHQKHDYVPRTQAWVRKFVVGPPAGWQSHVVDGSWHRTEAAAQKNMQRLRRKCVSHYMEERL